MRKRERKRERVCVYTVKGLEMRERERERVYIVKGLEMREREREREREGESIHYQGIRDERGERESVYTSCQGIGDERERDWTRDWMRESWEGRERRGGREERAKHERTSCYVRIYLFLE